VPSLFIKNEKNNKIIEIGDFDPLNMDGTTKTFNNSDFTANTGSFTPTY
jgi:hypothetical protein